jgi:urease accessory protein
MPSGGRPQELIMTKAVLRLSLAISATLISVAPSFAHHPMGGETPTNLFEGLASGVAHPVIGVDHFAFILAVGVLAAIAGARWLLPLAFVGGTLAGCFFALTGVEFAATEWLILLSVLALGLFLALGHKRFGPLEAGLIAVAGLFHGMAYAGGIIGAETGPLFAYLLGFAAIQAAIALGVMVLVRALIDASARPMAARVLGGVVLGIGLAFTVEGVEALIFPAIA